MSAKKKVLSGLIIVSWLSIMLFAVTAFSAAPALNLKSASVAINLQREAQHLAEKQIGRL